jgi:hypothetical protein
MELVDQEINTKEENRMYIDTQVVSINGNMHCIYCGKVANNETKYESHGREEINFYNCNCPGALIEIRQNQELLELNRRHNIELSDFIAAGRAKIREREYAYKRDALNKNLAKLNADYADVILDGRPQ